MSATSSFRYCRQTSHSWILSYDDPFYHPVSYSPTDKEVIDRGTANARRLLTPHALILQMLLSRLQAARYRRPGVMFLIQRLVFSSARAHKSLRSVFCFYRREHHLREVYPARTPWREKSGSHSSSSALKHLKAPTLTRIANMHCERASTLSLILGLPFALSKAMSL